MQHDILILPIRRMMNPQEQRTKILYFLCLPVYTSSDQFRLSTYLLFDTNRSMV
jgi:hypothetical protein